MEGFIVKRGSGEAKIIEIPDKSCAAEYQINDIGYECYVEGTMVSFDGETVQVRTRNLFNINGQVNTNTVNKSTAPASWTTDTSNKKNTVSNNVLTAYKNISETWPDGQKISVKTGQTYTLSFRKLPDTGYSGVVRVDYWNGSQLVYQINWWSSDTTRQSITFVAQADLILLGFGTTQNNGSSSFTDIMLEEGDQLTDYVPYYSLISLTTGLPIEQNNN